MASATATSAPSRTHGRSRQRGHAMPACQAAPAAAAIARSPNPTAVGSRITQLAPWRDYSPNLDGTSVEANPRTVSTPTTISLLNPAAEIEHSNPIRSESDRPCGQGEAVPQAPGPGPVADQRGRSAGASEPGVDPHQVARPVRS